MEGNIGQEKKRWIVLAIASFIAICLEIVMVFSGTVSGILASHFQLEEATIDWMILCNPAISIVCSIPMGIVARVYPLEVKKWFTTALFGLVLSNVLIAVSTVYKPLFPLMYVAEMICGAGYSIFVLLVCVTSVTWFAEHEQATAFGVAYGAFSLGNLLAAVMPATFLSYMKDSDISHVAYVTVEIYGGFAIFTLFLLCYTWIYIPNVPSLQPSKLELARRVNFYLSPPLGMKIATKQYFREWQNLMANWNNLALMFTYSISSSLFVVYFVMLPVLPRNSSSVSNVLLASTEKAYYLTSFAGGGTVASVVSGFVLDNLKSYRTLAFTQAFVSTGAALSEILSYRYSSVIGLYISVGLQGAAVMSSLAFTGEVLKQSAYPRVSEGTQATAIATVGCAVTVIVTAAARGCVSAFGEFSFYVTTGLCCLCESLFLLSINPTLTRFKTETTRLMET